ncbi:MAG: NAD-dependent epimerase/dehydratase family protein [Actinomycetota bacterium]
MSEPWQLQMFNKSLKKKQKFNALKSILEIKEGDRCIDICSGDNTGALSYSLRQLGGEWHTGDLEPENQEVMKDLLKENVYLLDADMLEFGDGLFDKLVTFDVLEHLEDEKPFLKEVSRVLKKGGRAYFTVPNQSPGLIGNKIKNLFGMRPEKYGHKRPGYTRKQLIDLLEANGFVVTKAVTYAKFYTEMVELLINMVYMLGSRKKKAKEEKKQSISPTSKEKLGAAYKLYSKLFPIFKLMSKLDKLLVLSQGYNVIVEAKHKQKVKIVPEKTRKEKVLVTGGGGFIGSHLVEHLLSKGYIVRTVDIHTENLRHIWDNENLEVVQADYLKEGLMPELVKGMGIVFHVASAHLSIAVTDEYYRKNNLEATRMLVEECRQKGVGKFIYISTVGVMKDMGRKAANEDSPLKPGTIYEKTKLMAEQYVKEYHQKTGYPIVVVRPSFVYGPRCPRTMKLFRQINKGRFFMVGNGSTYRQSAYVSDIAEGIWLASQKDKAVGQLYILSGDQKITVRDLVEGISELTKQKPLPFSIPPFIMYPMSVLVEFMFKIIKKEPPFSRRSLLFFVNNYLYDISKAKNDLGYKPRVSLKQGLKQTYEWIIENGILYK